MKKCYKCQIEKDIFNFDKNKKSKDGYHYHCKDCRKSYWKQYYLSNADKEKERCKINYLNNKEYWLERQRNYERNKAKSSKTEKISLNGR